MNPYILNPSDSKEALVNAINNCISLNENLILKPWYILIWIFRLVSHLDSNLYTTDGELKVRRMFANKAPYEYIEELATVYYSNNIN